MDLVGSIVNSEGSCLAEGPRCWRVAGDASRAMQLDAAIGDVLIDLGDSNLYHGYFLTGRLVAHGVQQVRGFLHQQAALVQFDA